MTSSRWQMVEVVKMYDVCASMWLEFCWVQFSAFSRSFHQTGSCINKCGICMMLRSFPNRWVTLTHYCTSIIVKRMVLLMWMLRLFKKTNSNQTCDYKKDGKFRLMENIRFVNNERDKLWLNWEKAGNHSFSSLPALIVLSRQALILCARDSGHDWVKPALSVPFCYTY